MLRPERLDRPTGRRTGRHSIASRTWSGARKTAASLTEVAKGGNGPMTDGDFWYATAAKLLAPLLFAAASGGRDMADVVRWVDTQEESEVFDLLDEAGVREAAQAAQSSFGKEDRQRSSMYTTAETVLEPFADPPVAMAPPGRAASTRTASSPRAAPSTSAPPPTTSAG